MVQINFASREINCKIVYYGPGRCGKTTNLQVVHAKAPKQSTGELVSIATETDRTLYFDFLPLDLGTVAGMRTKFSLYTVPGQVYYDATRKLVLQGADGVVFVADSNPDLMDENIESLQNLEKNLRDNGIEISEIPIVLQWNKRDLPNALSLEELNAKLNPHDWPTVEATAVTGEGVFKTLKVISQQVIRKLNRDQGLSADGKQRETPTSPPAVPPPPPAPRAVPPPAPPIARPASVSSFKVNTQTEPAQVPAPPVAAAAAALQQQDAAVATATPPPGKTVIAPRPPASPPPLQQPVAQSIQAIPATKATNSAVVDEAEVDAPTVEVQASSSVSMTAPAKPVNPFAEQLAKLKEAETTRPAIKKSAVMVKPGSSRAGKKLTVVVMVMLVAAAAFYFFYMGK